MQLRRGRLVDRACMMAFTANIHRNPDKRPQPFTYRDFMPVETAGEGEMDDRMKMRFRLASMGLLGPKAKVVNY